MFSNQEKYINLGTFKRSGEQVNTPLWFMTLDGESDQAIYSITNRDMAKARRVRNFPNVNVALCDFRGKLKGDWQDARATLEEDQDLYNRAFSAQRRKYGWQVTLVELLEKLIGKHKPRVVIKVTPALTDAPEQTAIQTDP